jgi:hypothetical protein
MKERDGISYPDDTQLHVGYVGQLIYGLDPNGGNGTLFNLIKAHDEFFGADPESGIANVLCGNYVGLYLEWLANQPQLRPV